jgi:hypothetical protein
MLYLAKWGDVELNQRIIGYLELNPRRGKMKKALLLLMGLLLLSAFVRAEALPSAIDDDTVIVAQADAALASLELDRAVTRENQAKINLDKATRALAKKPKSAKAKKALDKARQELASATRLREKVEARPREEATAKKEETTAKTVVTKKTEPAPKKAGGVDTPLVYAEYNAFLLASDGAEKLDPYYFFNDPVDSKGKTVVFDAKFDEITTPNQAKFTIWRNFGQMPMIVSGFSGISPLPPNQSALLYGVITDFKNVVVSGQLVLHAMVQLKGLFICANNLCPKDGLQKANWSPPPHATSPAPGAAQ